MSKQIQKEKSPSKTVEAEIAELPAPVETATADIDDLIDEIDAVLEENAETFVAQYVQSGGE